MVKLNINVLSTIIFKILGGCFMPLREINRIEAMDEMYINYTMKNDYHISPGDRIWVEVKRHFGPKGELKQSINQTYNIELSNPRWISIPRDVPGLQEYGVSHEDFLEVIYTSLRRGEEEMEVYPGEVREYLDFDPDREE